MQFLLAVLQFFKVLHISKEGHTSVNLSSSLEDSVFHCNT